PMQENMLFHRLYEKESTAYHEQFSFSLTGSVNLTWFEEAWNAVCRRHDALRTTFVYKGVPTPLQLVHKERPIEWRYEDLTKNMLSGTPATDIRNHIAACQKEDRQRGFQLDKDPLMRLYIFKVDEDKYRILWSYHHILMDGWCLGAIIPDIQEAYTALGQGKAVRLPPAPQYREYIRWLERADENLALAYWSEYLEGFHPMTSLPRDVNSEAGQGYLHEMYSFDLDGNLSSKLSTIARAQRVTINTLVQSIWGVVLAQANNISDVAFGAAVSGRPGDLPHVEQIVGLFINTIPVRMEVSPESTFTELMQKVQSESIAAEPHHFVSLAAIQTACQTEGQLVDHVLIFQNYPFGNALEELQKGYDTGFTFGELEALEQTGYDLSVEIYPLPHVHFDFRYNPHAYSREFLTRVSNDLMTIFKAVGENPQITIKELQKTITPKEIHTTDAEFLSAAMDIDDDF
ncbi:MAG: hypothetical protein HQK66_15540, partial [Desulfamplus sp.]|nr:hypothetical protein [Desulfamplus sp.]